MSHSAGSTGSAVLLEETKAACWGTFQRVHVRTLERLVSLNMASASFLPVLLDSIFGCAHVAQSRSWELLLFATLVFSPSKL